MPPTTSTTTPLGSTAPDFDLPDVTTGERLTLADLAGNRVLVVAFVCRHCPYVQHVKDELGKLSRDYSAGGDAALVAISSNDALAYPDDAPESLAEFAAEIGFAGPFLYDQTQAVARAYGAVCTPDFFVYDSARRLRYRGQLDGSRPNSGMPVTGADLRAAVDALLAGREVADEQKPSVGCSIKWTAGA